LYFTIIQYLSPYLPRIIPLFGLELINEAISLSPDETLIEFIADDITGNSRYPLLVTFDETIGDILFIKMSTVLNNDVVEDETPLSRSASGIATFNELGLYAVSTAYTYIMSLKPVLFIAFNLVPPYNI